MDGWIDMRTYFIRLWFCPLYAYPCSLILFLTCLLISPLHPTTFLSATHPLMHMMSLSAFPPLIPCESVNLMPSVNLLLHEPRFSNAPKINITSNKNFICFKSHRLLVCCMSIVYYHPCNWCMLMSPNALTLRAIYVQASRQALDHCLDIQRMYKAMFLKCK